MPASVLVNYRKWSWFFVAPILILFFLFFICPASLGIYYSLTDYNGFNRMNFVGFENYVDLLRDPMFFKTISRTLLYSLTSVSLVYISSLFVAILVTNTALRFKAVARICIYLPTLFSTVLVGLTWRWIFGERFGVLNYVLNIVGLSPVAWSTEPFAAFMTTVIASVWYWSGFYMIIFIGGIENIDPSLYEAAHMDGANNFQRFRNITLPQLRHVTFMVVILYTIESFKVFAQVITLTGGGPGNATTFAVQYIYQTGFERMRVGYASAASMMVFIILLLFSLVRYFLNRSGEEV